MRLPEKNSLKAILLILLFAFCLAMIFIRADLIFRINWNIPSSETSLSGSETASKKDKFDLSMEMLKGYYDGLESRSEKTVALLLVLVGWLITSDTARKSMKNDLALFWGAIITLTLLIVFLTVNLSHFLDKFISIRALAAELEYVTPKYFSRYPEMTRWSLLVYLAPILVFYAFILLLLFQIKYDFLSFSAATNEDKLSPRQPIKIKKTK